MIVGGVEVDADGEINRNMGCIEIDNNGRHGKKYGGLIETWDVLKWA